MALNIGKTVIRQTGKTEKQGRNGKYARNASNKASRASWGKSKDGNDKFPMDTCNGKRAQSIRKRYRRGK